MAIFDRLKSFADGLVDKPSEAEAPAEAPAPDEAPSGLMKSAMARAADTVLSASKKTLDLVISRYRPSLEADAVLSPEAIEKILAEPSDETKLDEQQLVRLGTNTLRTLPLAMEKHQRLKDESEHNLDLLKTALEEAEAEDKKKKQKELDEAKAAHDARYGEAAQPERLMTALRLIEQGETEAARAASEALLEAEPEFNHPVISRFMADQEGAQRPLWCERALWYHPLDLKLLQAMQQLFPEEEQRELQQLSALAQRGAQDVQDSQG